MRRQKLINIVAELDKKIKILYIDDEVNNLHSFKAMFRHDFHVLLGGSADEGLQILEENPDVKIIFCDQRMPGKTGVEFFSDVAQRFPDPVRMLITGYVDIESVINAINRGHIFRYLTKPWQELEVRSAIEEGYKYYTTSYMLKAKVRELQEANEELDKFTYSVTHDIRGPVVSILGGLQILKEMENLDEIRNLSEMMVQSAEKVKDLITNIHAYYSLKRGNLNIQEIDFAQLINEAICLHQITTNLHQIEVLSSVNQNEVFRSDATVLQLIFNNLISNAVKYQKDEEENKRIEIDLRVESGVAHLSIQDNGIGIDEQFKSQIFNMFFRATKMSSGSGFGLYNVKDALSKLGGTIDVVSQLGVGTKFVLTVPSK